MRVRGVVKTVGLVVLSLGALAALGGLFVRDQMSRHRRELFSSHPLRRLAALGYLASREASVEGVQLLRDFVVWEPRPLIRKRAVQILERMEARLQQAAGAPGEIAG